MLRNLLSGAWSDISSDFAQKVLTAVDAKDTSKLTSLLEELPDLGAELRKAISKGTDAIVATIQTKASAFWELHAKEVTGSSNLSKVPKDYQQTIRNMTANQVKLFAQKNPERILHPEISRQIEYLKEAELTRSVDVSRLSERMERVLSQDYYWENLSDVQVSRQWHANGVILGKQNGVTKGQISGPTNYPICPVCMIMMGLEFSIDRMSDKIDKFLGLTDIDEIKAEWSFPRIADVDNMSREELAAKGYLPPFHSNCRHGVTWLT